MKVGLRALVTLMLVVAVGLVVVACGKKVAGPTDADVTKAVTTAVESDGGTLKSAVTIVERGAQAGTDWPVTVEFEATAKDGTTSKQKVHYRLSSSINDMGVPVWTAAK